MNAFCSDCPQPNICHPPLHNMLICAGPRCVPGCPVYRWRERHGMTPGVILP